MSFSVFSFTEHENVSRSVQLRVDNRDVVFLDPAITQLKQNNTHPE